MSHVLGKLYRRLQERLQGLGIHPDAVLSYGDGNSITAIQVNGRFYILDRGRVIAEASSLQEAAAAAVLYELENTPTGRAVLLWLITERYPIARFWREQARLWVRENTGMEPEDWLRWRIESMHRYLLQNKKRSAHKHSAPIRKNPLPALQNQSNQ